MREVEYVKMRQVEDGYWWYLVLRELIVLALSDLRLIGNRARILDAGCGTGGTMNTLRRACSSWILSGFDVSPLAVAYTQERGFGEVIQASVDRIPLEKHSQDVIISLDVLYHSGLDQELAMGEFYRVLKPGGYLIMNLPAFDALSGQHDLAVAGERRYTPQDVRLLHSRHGFEIHHVYCWNAWLYPLLRIWRPISRRFASSSQEASSDLGPIPPSINGLLLAIGRIDAAICRYLESPIGTSVLSVALRPPTHSAVAIYPPSEHE